MVLLHWYFISPYNTEHLQWTALTGTLGGRWIKKQLGARGVFTNFFVWGGSAPKSNPLPFYIPFLTEKVSLSQIVILLHTLYYYMNNYCNLIGLEQWYFSLI